MSQGAIVNPNRAIPRFRLNNVTPFTYRDGLTYLQILEELRDKVSEVVEFSTENNDTVNAFIVAIENLIETLEGDYEDLLGSLLGYTIELTEYVYTAAMVDGSQFNAYTVAGTDKAIDDNVDPKLAAFESEIESAIEDFTTTVNSEIEDFTTTVNSEFVDIRGKLAVESGRWPRHYGAVGDGVADDSVALQAWADAGNSMMEPGMTYRTTATLLLEGDGRSLIGNGAEIHFHGDGTTRSKAVVFEGDHAHAEGVVIRGFGDVRWGIRVYGNHSTITNCDISEIRSMFSAQGIRVTGDVGGHRITNNTVKGVYAYGNEDTGDSTGASRGILLQSDTNTLSKPSLISGNVISDITGEEGDGIQVLMYDLPNNNIPFGRAYTTISNNVIEDCSRRHIKIQGSDVTVKGNVCLNQRPIDAPLPSWSINAIQSMSVEISGNFIRSLEGIVRGIGVDGASTSAEYCTVKNNDVRIPTDIAGTVIYVNNTDYMDISGNKVTGGSNGVSLGYSNDGVISGNTFYLTATEATVSNSRSVSINSSCNRIVVSGNVDAAWGARTSFRNLSENGVTVNNTSLHPGNAD